MKTISILMVLLCCILMFVVKREYKASLLIVGTVLFTLVKVPILPFHNANMLLPLAFLLSEFSNLSNLIKSAKTDVVWKLMGLALLIFIITILASPHLHDFSSIKAFFQTELFFKYFALLYAFWAFSTEESIRPTLRVTFYAMLVLTVFGIVNLMTKSADFVGSMMAGNDNVIGLGGVAGDEAGQLFAEKERFRVQAMFINPFDYGYICILMLLLHLYGFINRYERKVEFLIVAVCAVFGIVFCGCRTNIFCSLIGISVFFLFAFKLKKSLRLFLIFLAIAGLCYFYIPTVQGTIDNMMTMFDKKSDVTGSSMELRTLQYAAVLYHVQDNPLFGCGYNYFNIDMGWGQGKEYLLDQRLAGLEGVVMGYILERGFVGLFLYFSFYITIFVYFLKNRNYAPKVVAFGISVLCVYLTFANMTGELLSVYPTILLLGYVFKVVDFNRLKQQLGGVIRVFNFILSHISCRMSKTAWVC